MQQVGCGVIAAVDFLLYFSLHKNKIREENYLRYVNYVRHRYLPLIPKFGMPGYLLPIGLNRYFRKNRLPYRAVWGSQPSKIFSSIEEMLAQDMPVIFSVGPDFPLFFRKHYVNLYRQISDKTKEKQAVNKVRAHFMVITGMDKTWMEVSSWGKEYYISREEYAAHARKYSTYLTSNICMIRHIKKK